MCRLLAYLGPNISLNRLLFEPEHSLEKQAWQPRELREAKLNADGFGIGWYHHRQAMRYRQPIPIWNDANLEDLASSLHADLYLATVRSATPGLGVGHYNTQPFRYQNWLFMHNGYIRDFAETGRPQIRKILAHEFEANIQGNTDSEYIFALILHFLENDDMTQAIVHAFSILNEILGQQSALLNVMLSDGEKIYATRYAINGLSPSLYYGANVEGFAPDSQLIVSEALSDSTHWQVVDEHRLLIMSRDDELVELAL